MFFKSFKELTQKRVGLACFYGSILITFSISSIITGLLKHSPPSGKIQAISIFLQSCLLSIFKFKNKFIFLATPLLVSNFGASFPGFLFYFSFIFISWRLITLQYWSGFCHTLTLISHGFTCVPHPDPPSHLPLHPIPLGLPSAPDPSTCLIRPTWAGDLFHPR